ncbi:hypothetical protein L228DRAFT_153333 [Xylona heveae TC161]|uniref:CENP-V/GFA domain-containing protein n=1 Tax=Xylona heveae (strain CBS 132557 / TC161) TaxID=1328760 RepID=A0A165GQ24_XYLHT|nr:hypothetical protein L228DRAFT_153333 [Xylona heveae TC161]KZF22455.1 hypothetical protein L228DRAFT_153333 [Xylona heveae TC161]
MATHTGKCDCGQLEWTVKLEDESHVLCHCDTCKKLSGGAFTLNQIVPKDNVKVLKGDLKNYTYAGESGNPVHCYYCANCTTSPFHHQTVLGDKYVVRTGLLDNYKELKPSAEIFGKAKLSWLPEVATTFETLPPS